MESFASSQGSLNIEVQVAVSATQLIRSTLKPASCAELFLVSPAVQRLPGNISIPHSASEECSKDTQNWDEKSQPVLPGLRMLKGEEQQGVSYTSQLLNACRPVTPHSGPWILEVCPGHTRHSQQLFLRLQPQKCSYLSSFTVYKSSVGIIVRPFSINQGSGTTQHWGNDQFHLRMQLKQQEALCFESSPWRIHPFTCVRQWEGAQHLCVACYLSHV